VNDEPHEPTEECQLWHCAWHNVDEDAVGYRLCGECLHTYPTAAELIFEYWANAPDDLPYAEITADQILFCPLCSHDF
jgi:hypothetical protein